MYVDNIGLMAEYEAIIYAKFLGFYAFFLTLFATAVHAPVVEGGAAFIGMGLGLWATHIGEAKYFQDIELALLAVLAPINLNFSRF